MSQELWYHLPLTVTYPGSRYDTIPLKRDLDFDILKLSKVASRRNDAIDKSFLSSTAGIIDVPLIFIVSRTPDGNGYEDFSVRGASPAIKRWGRVVDALVAL